MLLKWLNRTSYLRSHSRQRISIFISSGFCLFLVCTTWSFNDDKMDSFDFMIASTTTCVSVLAVMSVVDRLEVDRIDDYFDFIKRWKIYLLLRLHIFTAWQHCSAANSNDFHSTEKHSKGDNSGENKNLKKKIIFASEFRTGLSVRLSWKMLIRKLYY